METETSPTQSTETFYKILAWLHANRKQLLIGIGVVGTVGLIAGIFAWYKSQQATDAEAALFDIPVASAAYVPLPTPASGPFLSLASKYPNTSAGEYAVLLGAESLFVDGNYAEAQQEFTKFADEQPDSPLVAQAKVGVAACLEATGKTTDAIQKYTALISAYPGELNIIGPAKLTLARLYEQSNRPDEALTLYSDLARSQNPYDPWAAEARDRGMILLAKHPELRRTEQTPAPAPFSVSQAAAPPAAAPAAPAPAPQTKPASQPLNLLNFPAASSNATPKP